MNRILPAEILDLIVDELRDDYNSLMAASLSCKRLLTRSRFHLFHTLEIGEDHLTNSDIYTSGRKSTYSRITVPTFLQILDVPYSSIGHAIRCLVIDRIFDWDTKLPRELSRIRKNLPNVTTLRCKRVPWLEIPRAFRSLLLKLNFEMFIISDLWLDSPSKLAKMIAKLPSNLKKIAMGSIHFHTPEDKDTNGINFDRLAKRKVIHFHTLDSVSSMGAQNFFRSLISLRLITIDRFIIGRETLVKEEFKWIDEVLVKFGSRFSEVIHHLVPAKNDIWNGVPSFSLRHCTNLRVLSIQSVYLGSQAGDFDVFTPLATRVVRRIISSVPNLELLEEIQIRFTVDLFQWSDETASIAASTTVLAPPSDDRTAPDTAPFIDQLAEGDWTDLANFLLCLPFSPSLESFSSTRTNEPQSLIRYPSSSTSPLCHTVLSATSPKRNSRRRIHIQLGFDINADKVAQDVFSREYTRCVEYIYNHGMKNIVDDGRLELVFSRVNYKDLYEIE
ncbi:hypothetical protein C8R42DRAFT_13416 [Lentinula raphanica]|nr:hypothetical protein C8R42DRAFT_13416 [Lentinula raphanica]